MKRNTPTRQSGYALVMMVVALMGVGGIVIAGFTQQAKKDTEHQRYLHNERILKQAKQALLQYAYNYPVTAGNGPGRLPCPDINNNGTPDPVPGCDGAAGVIGRFPWATNELNFHEARDASGELLWYAVSNNFGNSGSVTLNSDTPGTITVQDRSGALLHDATAGNGVVAVIIAPGPAIERNGVLQDRAAGPNVAANYLDLFGAVDNADFVNNSTNGFVTGPIYNPVDGSLLVNDQMILVTAAEVIAMAEKATLQAYREAIDEYRARTGGVYPWLYNYEGIEYDSGGGELVDVAIDKLSTFYPADANFATEKATWLGVDTAGSNDGIYGRIPSIFTNYFTESDSLKIESRLVGSIDFDFSGLTVGSAADGDQQFLDGVVSIPFSTVAVATDVGFEDIADTPGTANGRFTATLPAPETFTRTVYFWDDDDNPTNVWRICANGADDISDCWRDSAGNPPPHATNDNKEYILEVVIQFQLSGTLILDTDFNVSPPTSITYTAATATDHAYVQASYNVGNLLASSNVTPMITANYIFDHHYHGGGSEVFEADPNTSLGGLTTADLAAGTTLTVGMRYFPELPDWTFDNEWHNAIRMAYALEYEPPGTGPCVVDTTCLRLDDTAGAPQNVASLLVIAGQHDWQDVDANDRLKNDLLTVFDNGNENTNPTFYRHRGNDDLLVIEEL